MSSAAVAASWPLLDGPSPARARASSAVFVVRSPNETGTCVMRRSMMRREAASAMYSKCGVSPRIRHPRHTTPGRGDARGGLCQLIGAGDSEGHDVGARDAGVLECGTRLEPIGHKRVVSGDDQGKTHQGPRRSDWGDYRPLKSGFRFSRKAFVPSRMSSVVETRPKSVAS